MPQPPTTSEHASDHLSSGDKTVTFTEKKQGLLLSRCSSSNVASLACEFAKCRPSKFYGSFSGGFHPSKPPLPMGLCSTLVNIKTHAQTALCAAYMKAQPAELSLNSTWQRSPADKL